MAHAQKPDFVFRHNGRVHLNRRGRQFSRLLAAEVCASAVVMLDTPCSEVVWRVLATHSIRQFPLHFPSRASPCAITFQLESSSFSPGKMNHGRTVNTCFLLDPFHTIRHISVTWLHWFGSQKQTERDANISVLHWCLKETQYFSHQSQLDMRPTHNCGFPILSLWPLAHKTSFSYDDPEGGEGGD